jgi:DNA-binding GntR family transcriptional regulator
VARRQGNQSELTYRQLKDLIVSGQLEPGERLVEAQIAEELGVSRTPVREALRRLLDEHLISRDTTGALTVHQATQREIEDIYTIREVLDGLAARLAARRISETDLLWMSETIEAMQEAATGEDPGEVVAANLTFHDVLYGAAGNPRLHRMGQELRDFVRLFSREPLAAAGRAAEIADEHETILAALREGDADRAEEASRAHVRRARENLALAALNRPSA